MSPQTPAFLGATPFKTLASLLVASTALTAAPALGQQVVEYDNVYNANALIVLTDDAILHRSLFNGQPATQNGVISGGYGVTKTGEGHLFLNGANTYSGGTVVQEGVLWLGNDQALGTGDVTMAGGALFTDYGSARMISNNVELLDIGNRQHQFFLRANVTWNGDIFGDGRLQKDGEATLVLDGDNSYAGGTQLDWGVLKAMRATALGTGDLDFGDRGTLAVADSVTLANNITTGAVAARVSVGVDETATLSGRISGNAPLIKSGDGTLRLTGDADYTGATRVAAGELRIAGVNAIGRGALVVDDGATLSFDGLAAAPQHTVGSLAGAGHINFDGRWMVTGGDNSDTEFSGTFSNFSQLTKVGLGAMTLSNDYLDLDDLGGPGRIIVNEGRLNVFSEIVNGVVIGRNSGVIGGMGNIEGLYAYDSSVISPGELPGDAATMQAGDITFASTAFYEVDAHADGSSDRIEADLARLAGTVRVRAAAGDYADTTQYRILTVTDRFIEDNSVPTRFDGVTSDLFFLDASLSYDPNNVWLTLARNSRSFDQISGITPNQRAVAPAVEGLGAGNVLYDTIVSGTEAEGHAALDALSGEIHASVGTGLIEDSHHIRDTLLNRMRQPFSALVNGSFAALGYADDGGLAPDAWTVTPWTQTFGGFQQFNSNGNASKLRQGTGGVLFGLDGTFENRFRVGIAGGVSGSRLSGDTGPSSIDVTSYHLAAYGAADLDALALRFGASYSWNTLASNRAIAFRSFADEASARYGAQTGQVFGEVGYKLAVGQVMVEPFAGLALVGVGADAFNESGGAAALSGGRLSQASAFATLGVRGNWTVTASEAGILSLNAGIGWRHAFNGGPGKRDLAFNAGGPAFQVSGVPLASDSLVLDAGLDYETANGLTLGVNYTGQLAGNAQSHAVKASLGFSF